MRPRHPWRRMVLASGILLAAVLLLHRAADNSLGEPADAAKAKGIPLDVPFGRLTPEQKKFIMDGEGEWYGVKGFFEWLQTKKYKVQVRVFLSRYRKYIACPTCRQTRLNPQALSVRVGGLSIGELVRMTVQEAQVFLDGLALLPSEKQVAEKLVAEIQNRLKFLLRKLGVAELFRRLDEELDEAANQRMKAAMGIAHDDGAPARHAFMHRRKQMVVILRSAPALRGDRQQA